jgi:hypothetical protein
MSDQEIKKLRLRGKISSDGIYWKESSRKADSLGNFDIKVTLIKRGKKDYLVRFDPLPNTYAYRTCGIGYSFAPDPSDIKWKTTDDFISNFISYFNKKTSLSSNFDISSNPCGHTDFTKYYAGLTQSGLPAFYEIVQDPYDPDVVPSYPDGYFDIWNKWADSVVASVSIGTSGTSGTSGSSGTGGSGGTGSSASTAGTSGTRGTGGTGGTGGSASGTASVDPKTINTTLKLKKKSGPGELMGQSENTVYLGECLFKELQFDQPGEYVIEVIPGDDAIEKTEFKITVLGDPLPSSVEKPAGPSASEGTRPIIAQIDPPTLRLKPIMYNLPDNPDQESLEIASAIGKTPFLWFNSYNPKENGFQIEERSILTLSLYHEGMTPCSSVTFTDSKGKFNKDAFPLDDTTYEIFLNSNSENLKSIHLRFKLSNFKENKDKSYTISGTIDLKDYYKIKFKSYTGTSFEVLREISKELELGFNSNIMNTDDSMRWTNVGKKYRDLMSGIMKHSYINDKSFMLGYIDFYYCFNFVDLEKEWGRNIGSDVGIDSSGLRTLVNPKEEEKLVKLVLSTDHSDKGTMNFISEYSIKNNSTAKSIENGHFTITKYYDTASKSFLIFNVDSQTSTDDSKLILKGKPEDGKDIVENFRTSFGGKFDLLNVHKNYLYAKTQNEINITNLTKISCEFIINSLNFNLYMYQKVQIIFSNQAQTITDPSLTQQRLTGDWMIIDIKYTWVQNKITQKIIAVRKELEKLPEEKDQVTKTDPETKGESKNETVEELPPNSIYEPGEIYRLKDKDGNEYTILIESLLSNGNEIQGYIADIPKIVPEPPVSETPVVEAATSTTGDSGTEPTDSKTIATEAALTPDQQLDLIVKRVTTSYATDKKDPVDGRVVTVSYNSLNNYINFYNSGKFTNYKLDGTELSKGNFYNAGRKLVVSSGLNKGETFETEKIWDTLKLLTTLKTKEGSLYFIVGDSIAAGLSSRAGLGTNRSFAYGIKSKDIHGITQVGASPKTVLGFLAEIGNAELHGKKILLSCGYTNDPSQKAQIEAQLKQLKACGATVLLVGATNKPPKGKNLEYANFKLKELADKYGATFLGEFEPAADGLHPKSYASYYDNNVKKYTK